MLAEENKTTYAESNPEFIRNEGNDRIYYGTYPKVPVAEQNQTYFAYFDGIGGTGPEYIDGTAYFIKYLIDTEGNVVNPEPFTVADSPQAVGLYNLTDNFEVGKNATVKLIEPNPTIDEIPNAEILQGTHRIAHVGRIVPIAVSENGENIQNYVATMSFGPLSTQFIEGVQSIGNVTARFNYTSEFFWANSTSWANLPFQNTLINSNNTWINNSPTFTIQSSSADTLTRIDFQIKLWCEGQSAMTDPPNPLYVRVLQNGTPIWASSAYNVYSTFSGYVNFASTWVSSYLDGDDFTVQYRVDKGGSNNQFKIQGTAAGRGETWLNIRQETAASSGIPDTTNVLLTEGINAVYSPYFVVMQNFLRNIADSGSSEEYFVQEQAPYNYSYLCMSEAMSSLYNSELIQNLDPTSATMGFSEIKIPFSDIRPGDFIRFEYDKNKIFTITEIILDYKPISNLDDIYTAIKVTPNIAFEPYVNETDMETFLPNVNHFVIYRTINDGVYVTLDVKKDAPGGAYSGILQPEFVSKELVQKYDKIIQNLTEKEIIQ
jgi:hypothetical protein